MREMRRTVWIAVALVACVLAACPLAGCTVAIPDAAHFPEARDTQTADAPVDVGDAKDATADAVDAKDAAGTDAVDAAPDVAKPDADAAAEDADVAQTQDAAQDVAPDAALDVGDDATATEDVAPDGFDASTDAATDAVDASPSCTPSQCDDGNPCTFDDCGANAACVHANLAPTPCPDDGLPCTGDTCQDGVCTHTTLLANWCIVAGVCFASGTLSADNCATCAPDKSPVAWTPLPDLSTCSDGTACTVGDHCQAGACLPGSVTTCDDGNPCTADTCDAQSGCSNANLDDGSGCPAAGVCQLPGFCLTGTCSSAPKLWSTSIDGGTGGVDGFRGVAVTSAGQVIVVGARQLANGTQAGWAQHLDAASDLVESLPELVDAAGDAHYSCVAVAADGSLALGGATTTEAVVRLVHADGTQQKVTPFSGAGDVRRLVGNGAGWLALDDHGDIVQLDPNGATIWSATANALGSSVLRDVTPMPDGGALAVGATANSALAARFSVTGKILWQRAFGDSGEFFAVHAVDAATVFVAGSQTGGLGPTAWFGHLDGNGNWLRENVWQASSFATLSGGVFLAGSWHLWGDDGVHAWQGAFDPYGNFLWQKAYDNGAAWGIAAFPDGGVALVGSAATPADGLVLRTDAWGEDFCSASQLCSNLTTAACDDGLVCTADLCTAGSCSHSNLDTAPCDDGAICSVVDTCVASQCAGGSGGLFDSTDGSVSQWSLIAARADGGAVLAGSAGLVARKDAAGTTVWSHFVTGVTAVGALPNGVVVALQGTSGGTLQRFSAGGTSIPGGIAVDGASGGKSAGMAVLSDDAIVVIGTADFGAPSQTAFVERFDAAWTGTPVTLPGNFGSSQGLAIAASGKGGCGVLTVEGAAAKIHRLDKNLQEIWAKQLSLPTHIAIAVMPDDGWLVAGPGPKGLALERYGPDGAFEFAEQWPISGLTDVRALAVLPDGTCAVAVEGLAGGFSQGGIVRFGPLGGLLSIAWGKDGSQLFAIAAVNAPSGVWAVGSASGGGWDLRTDSHGGVACASSGGCVSESLVCDDGNPCTNDGCVAGKCTTNVPAIVSKCLNGGDCTGDGACPLLGACGDGKCNINENSTSCAGDCPSTCDSVTCDDGDPCTIDYCQAGACAIGGVLDGTACAPGKVCSFAKCAPPSCGDGTCEPGETASNCPADCPACGDGTCGAGENNHVCPADCPKPTAGCQNLCGWKSQKVGGGVCWCDVGCTPGPGGDCCDDKATFCP